MIWQSQTREILLERFVYGGAFCAGTALLLLILVAVGLALPFAFL